MSRPWLAMGSPSRACPQSSPLPACTPLPSDRAGRPDGRRPPGLASVGPPRHQHAPGQDCPSQAPGAVPAFTIPSRVCSGPVWPFTLPLPGTPSWAMVTHPSNTPHPFPLFFCSVAPITWTLHVSTTCLYSCFLLPQPTGTPGDQGLCPSHPALLPAPMWRPHLRGSKICPKME